VAVVDGNVERVLCRLAGWDTDGSTAQKRKVGELAARLVDPERPGDFNQAMMELGATVCLPRNPQCLACPLREDCRTRGEHKTRPRAAMVNREAAYALVLRTRSGGGKTRKQESREVLLEQRAASQTVMPGLWELPALRSVDVLEQDLRMTVRHSIMQVNYTVRICNVSERDVAAMTLHGGELRWVGLAEADGMALTGLARKVLVRAHLLPGAGQRQ
jgi:A/G-specific adenine glycosylase